MNGVKELQITEELIRNIKDRNLTGYYPLVHIFPEKESVVAVWGTEGYLIVPDAVYIYTLTNIKQVDMKLMKKIEELVKIETLSRIIFGIYNGWEHMFEIVVEKDLYAFTSAKDRNGKSYLFINNIELDSKESDEFFSQFLYMEEGKRIPADISFYQKSQDIMPTQQFGVRLRKRGTIDEILEFEKNRLKDMAFEYPETYAVVKKVYNLHKSS